MWFSLPPIAFQPYFEYRVRYERRNDPDFDTATNDNRSDLYSRWRPGFYVRPMGNWMGEFQYQYASDLIWTDALNSSTANSDVSLGYVRYSDPIQSATVGRQKIFLGDQRLVGPGEWQNVPRSFDGADGHWRSWELFGFAIAVNRVPDARLAGLVDYHKGGYTGLLYKHDHPGTGEVDLFTLDEYCNRTSGDWTVHFEGAGQAGQANGVSDSGFAGHLKVDRSIQKSWYLYVEGNVASGGYSSTHVNTFDNLYPANHNLYGLLDLQAWKNMYEAAIGTEFQLSPTVKGRLHYDRLWLYDATDAWYTFNGTVAKGPHGISFQDPTGQSGRDVGDETDLIVTWNVKNGPTIAAGVGLFDPGSFVKNVSGVANQQTYGYLSIEQRFK